MSDRIFPVSLPGMTLDVGMQPEFKTMTQSAENGAELRLALRSFPLWRFEFQYEFLRDTAALNELRTLVGFFAQSLGSADSWLLLNPDDYQANQVIGAGDGTNRDFQLYRAFGAFNEPVFWPASIDSVRVDGSPVGYTQRLKGVVRLSTAPAAGAAVSWTGSFYYRCRFDNDVIDAKKFMTRLWKVGKLAFTGSLQDKVRA